MKIAVLGSTGETGRAVIRRALDRGHSVTALARTPERLADLPGVTVVTGNALDREAIVQTITGADVVFSSLGLSAAGANDELVEVCTIAMSHALAEMPELGVTRLVAMSTHGVGDSNDGSDYVTRLWGLMGERLRDKENMELLFADDSAIDWTIVRAPRISDDPGSTVPYRAAAGITVPLGGQIPRDDLADFLIAEIEKPQHAHEKLTIAR